MTNKKNDEVVEVDGEKGEKPENVVVHVHKDGAAKIEKLKKTLISKKSTSTRFINKLKEQAVKFKAATETDNRDNTSTTKTALKITANQVIDTRNKLMKYSSEVEILADEISDALIQYSASGAEEKLLTDAHGITDSIEEILSEYITIISEAIDASKEATPQRNSSAPATITQQGELFRDVPSLKPSFLEKGANLMEVLLWNEQARNYIEAGFKDPPPEEGTWRYLAPYVHSFWSGKLIPLNPKSLSLDTILNTLESEAKKGDPKHNRRLRMMNDIRRGSEAHSDYMNKLIEASRIIEFESMTLDELIIHLFIRDADATMSKIAQDELMVAQPNVYNVVNMIQQYESQSWYNPKKKRVWKNG